MASTMPGNEALLLGLDDILRHRHELLEANLRAVLDRQESQLQQLVSSVASLHGLIGASLTSPVLDPSFSFPAASFPMSPVNAFTDDAVPSEKASEAPPFIETADVLDVDLHDPGVASVSEGSLGEGRGDFQLAKSRTGQSVSRTTLRTLDLPEHSLQLRARKMLNHPVTEILVAAITCLSAVMVGAQVNEAAANAHIPGHQSPAYFNIVNHALTLCFLVELLTRMFAYGKEFVLSEDRGWNMLDCVIVGCAVGEFVLDVGYAFASGMRDESGTDLSIMKAMRVVRILRLVRVVRVVRFFRALRVLIASIVHTLKSVVWALILLFLIMYTFGILFTHAYTDYTSHKASTGTIADMTCTEPSTECELRSYFGSVLVSILLLFAAISDGISWISLITPLWEASGDTGVWLIMFLAYIALVEFAVLNVVTGVFCQNAIESASLDQEMVIETQLKSKQLYTDQVCDLFHLMDEGKKGELTAIAFEQHINDPQVAAYFRALDMDLNNVWKLFTLLDPDGSGTIDLQEFVEGCLKLRGPATRLDMELVLSVARSSAKRQNQLVTKLDKLERQLRSSATASIPNFRQISQASQSPGIAF
ncbi:Scn11a [Symbiodinium sp. CCMP2592]|nr:Scn11a [Symbiodinium sp. CCMP2592]